MYSSKKWGLSVVCVRVCARHIMTVIDVHNYSVQMYVRCVEATCARGAQIPDVRNVLVCLFLSDEAQEGTRR